jgi:hypothetical protein
VATADPLAEARRRENEAIRAFRLALARADETWALGARLLAELDERLAAVCLRLRQAGYFAA